MAPLLTLPTRSPTAIAFRDSLYSRPGVHGEHDARAEATRKKGTQSSIYRLPQAHNKLYDFSNRPEHIPVIVLSLIRGNIKQRYVGGWSSLLRNEWEQVQRRVSPP